MRVLTACKSFVSQLAHWLDLARTDTVYVPQHVTPHLPMVQCPTCHSIFTVITSDIVPETEARLLWGDQ